MADSGAPIHGSRLGVTSASGELCRVFGPSPRGSRHDLLRLARDAEMNAANKKLPALHLDCGSEDHLVGDNRTFHAELEKLGIPHLYAEHPGVHNWDYWEQHVGDGLRFVAGTMGIESAGK